MRRPSRVHIGLIAVVLCLPIVVAGVVLFSPQLLFVESLSVENVTVYSENEIDARWTPIIDDAMALVRRSELHDAGNTYNILLVANSTYSQFEGLVAKPIIAKASYNRVFIGGEVDLDSRQLITPVLRMDLVRTLAHELTHCAENAKYGMLDSRKTPPWKREGYAEYIAHANDREKDGYSLSLLVAALDRGDGSAQWIDLHGGIVLPRTYINHRLLVEYLIDVQQMSYDEIVHAAIPVAKTLDQIKDEWSQAASPPP